MGFKASVKQCCLRSTLFEEGEHWACQDWKLDPEGGRACYVESCRYCVSSAEGFVAVETSRRRLIDSSPSLLEP